MDRVRSLYAVATTVNDEAILDALLPVNGGLFVDLGCGDGRFTSDAARRVGAGRTVGIETDETYVKAATARGIEVVEADLGQALPFENTTVDGLVSNQVIEHLWDTDLFLKEIRRVLRPGGYAVVSTNNMASWHNVVSLTMGWQPMPNHVSDEVVVGNPMNVDDRAPGSSYPMHRRIFTNRALRELAEHHGLRVEHDVTAGYYPLGPKCSRIATRVDKRHGAFLVQRYQRVA